MDTDTISLAAYACESCLINHTYQFRHHRSGPCPLCGQDMVVADKEDQVRAEYNPINQWAINKNDNDKYMIESER